MSIPTEAVEAAMNVWFDRVAGSAHEHMRAALEAAAPHMLAEAWDAAVDAAYERRVIGDSTSDALKLGNPYRPTQ